METIERVNFYRLVHKSIRKLLFDLSISLGNSDFRDINVVITLHQRWNAIEDLLQQHAFLEEKYFHPLIYRHLPIEAKALDETHHQQEESLNNLSKLFHELKEAEKSADREILGQDLYLVFNHFIAEYLLHLHEEEAQVMPALWAMCDDMALGQTIVTFLTSMSKEDYQKALTYYLEAVNPREKALLLSNHS